MRVVLAEIEEWNASHPEMEVRLILSVDRAKHGPEEAEGIVDLALKLREEGKPVVGLDVCGDPSSPRPIEALRPAFERARAAGLECVLHFAEVPASSSVGELRELLDWKPRRLGHAIHVPEEIAARIVAEGVGVEMCLSCNVLAGMLPSTGEEGCPGIADHHFGEWWARGVPICLGTDDIGVFGSTSSEEHAHAAVHFGLSAKDMLTLGERAVAGALDGAQKARVRRLLEAFARREGVPWAAGAAK